MQSTIRTCAGFIQRFCKPPPSSTQPFAHEKEDAKPLWVGLLMSSIAIAGGAIGFTSYSCLDIQCMDFQKDHDLIPHHAVLFALIMRGLCCLHHKESYSGIDAAFQPHDLFPRRATILTHLKIFSPFVPRLSCQTHRYLH